MTKLIISVLTVLILFSGCQNSATKDIDVSKVTADIVKGTKFEEALIEANENAISNYYTIDTEKIVEYKIYICSTGSTAEEIAVFKVKSDMEDAKRLAQKRIDDLITAFEDYMPAEVNKLKNAVVYSKGNYLLLAITDDSKTASAIFEEAFK